MRRFFRYFLVGGSTLILDFCILFSLVHWARWQYLVAAGTSFVIAVSVNYFISRRFVFPDSARPVASGYAFFFSIAGAGLAVLLLLMALFVGVFHWNYLVARLVIASVVGIWNYLMNLRVTFRIR